MRKSEKLENLLIEHLSTPPLATAVDLEKCIIKSGGGYNCSECGKFCLDKTAAKNHVEALHFPSHGHTCNYCGIHVKTKNALNNHVYRHHKK